MNRGNPLKLLIFLLILFSNFSFGQSVPVEKISVLTCDFSYLTSLGHVINDEQKSYELNLALLNYLTLQNEKEHVFDHWGVQAQLVKVAKSINESRVLFERSISQDVMELTCSCLAIREQEIYKNFRENLKGSDRIDKFNHIQNLVNSCRNQEVQHIANTSWQLPLQETVRQNKQCAGTMSGQSLVTSGDSATYMHSCFYCPVGSTYQNPFNNLSQVDVMSCESTTVTEDRSRGEKGKLLRELMANDEGESAHRILLLDIEKTVGKIQEKYLQRTQKIQTDLENVYHFAKNVYEKDKCDDCFRYVGVLDNKTLIADPWYSGLPVWAMITAYNTNYTDASKRLGQLDLYRRDHLKVLGHNEYIRSLFGDVGESDRGIILKYFKEEHYLKPKKITLNQPLPPNLLSPTSFKDNFSLKEYGAAYPFEGMLTYIKSLFNSTQKLNSLGQQQLQENKKLVSNQTNALKKAIQLKIQLTKSVPMELKYRALIASIESDQKEESEISKIIAKLGVNDNNELVSGTPLGSNILNPIIEGTSPQFSLTGFANSTLGEQLMKNEVLRFNRTVTMPQLMKIKSQYNYALGNIEARKTLGNDQIKNTQRFKSYLKNSEELFSNPSALLEKNSFKSFYFSEQKSMKNKEKKDIVFTLFQKKPFVESKNVQTVVELKDNQTIDADKKSAEIKVEYETPPVLINLTNNAQPTLSINKEALTLRESALIIKSSPKEMNKLKTSEDDSLFDKVSKAYKRNYYKIAQ